MLAKHSLRNKRHARIRHTVAGTGSRPRLSVYRGLRHIYAQLIDDTAGKTLYGVSDKTLSVNGSGMDRAKALGAKIAEWAKANKIESVVYDRGGFRYHGQVKALADAVRDAGITI